jgi:hypothetical protein
LQEIFSFYRNIVILERREPLMSEESIRANSDVSAIDFFLEQNSSDSAIVINLRVFNRLMTHHPELFTLKGKAIIYKENTHVYFHSNQDGDIRTKKANKSLEDESF